MMMRAVIWSIFWGMTLFCIDIHVVYEDGLTIEFKGWGTPLVNWLNK